MDAVGLLPYTVADCFDKGIEAYVFAFIDFSGVFKATPQSISD